MLEQLELEQLELEQLELKQLELEHMELEKLELEQVELTQLLEVVMTLDQAVEVLLVEDQVKLDLHLMQDKEIKEKYYKKLSNDRLRDLVNLLEEI